MGEWVGGWVGDWANGSVEPWVCELGPLPTRQVFSLDWIGLGWVGVGSREV